MDSLAHDEPTQRVEPGAAPARDEAHPSRPGRSGTLVAPPPPGLVALPSDTDAPWRRPDDPPPSRRHATPDPTPPRPVVAEQAATHDPGSPQPVVDEQADWHDRALQQQAMHDPAPQQPVGHEQAVPHEPAPQQSVAQQQTGPHDPAPRQPVTHEQAGLPESTPTQPVADDAASPTTAPDDPASPPTVARDRVAAPPPEPVTEGPAVQADGVASPPVDDSASADRDDDLADDPEPAFAPERQHPAWLGEPTGHFDLDLPEPGRTNPSWLGEPNRRADPDEPFDQYALPDDAPSAAFSRTAGRTTPDTTGSGPVRAARNAVTVDLADQDSGHGLPDTDARSAPGRRMTEIATPGAPALAPPAGHRPVAGAPPAQALGNSAHTEAFTMPVQEVPRESWIDPRLHGARRARPEAVAPPKRPRPPRAPRRAGVAMPFLIFFALVSAFFSWVSAEPLWLALGHGETGTLTVTSCAGSGLLERCVGEFATPARDFTVDAVNVLGPPGQAEGLSAPARMVGANSHRAYVTNGTGGLHLRWIVGLSIVLLCSIAIVFATGALRLPERRERLAAVGLAFAGPLLVTIGFLAATF